MIKEEEEALARIRHDPQIQRDNRMALALILFIIIISASAVSLIITILGVVR